MHEKLDVLLVSPYTLRQDVKEQQIMKPYPALGLLYIAAALRQEPGLTIEIFDNTFTQDAKAFSRTLAARKPRIVGIHANIVCREIAGKMIREAKEAGAIVMTGGPDPSTYEDMYLRDFGADYLVLGEGETTARDLVRTLLTGGDVGLVQGLGYLKDGAVFRTPARHMVKDIDVFPMPAWDMLDLQPYFEGWRKKHGYTSLHIMTSRGCPFSCNWCSKEIFARTFRQHSPQRVTDEMVHLKQTYGVDQLWLADDLVGVNKKWMTRWRDEVVSRNAAIPYECLTRVDLVNETLLQQLKDTGCWKIYYGAESGSQKVLDAMHKEAEVTEIYTARRLTKQANIQVGFFMMFGYPGEELADIKLTEKMLMDLVPDSAGFSVAYPLRGTPFYEQMKAQMQPQQHQWSSTNENRLLFEGRFPNRYYALTIRSLMKRMQVKRDVQARKFKPVLALDLGKIAAYETGRRAVLLRSEWRKKRKAALKTKVEVAG